MMATDVILENAAPNAMVAARVAPARPYLFHRHALVVRATHWINALAILFLLMTGLNIFNAHPMLYWGEYGANPDTGRQWLQISSAVDAAGQNYGYLRVGDLTVRTTGVLGLSAGPNGSPQSIGYPSWSTFPSYRDLATARNWHFFFAWVLILNGLFYLAYGIASGHLGKNLLPRRKELRVSNIVRDIVMHAKLKFPKGDEAKRYHILQKLAYAGVVLVLVPGIILTGIGMSPGLDAAVPVTVLLGGRQTSRSLHWIFSNLMLAFIIVHLAMVVLAGPYNEIRSMITGKFRIDPETKS
jgi:thiosulfate reductase cytochrome b subunit